ILNNALMFNVLLSSLLAGKDTYVFIRELHMPKVIMKIYEYLVKLKRLKILSNNNAIKTIYPNLAVEIVNNVVEIKPFREKALNEKNIRVLLVGSIYELKNQLLALEIVKFLKSEFSYNIVVDHYGETISESYKESILEFVNKEGLQTCVNFKGKVENDKLITVYSDYDIYIQSSNSEGMSRALLDAVNAGLFVIATDVGDTKYLIKKGTGVLIENGDFQYYLSDFPKLYSNSNEITKNAHLTLVSLYSEEAVSNQLKIVGLNVD
ncbi:glycosyltransferase, partial [Pseudoalteromonas piscicida]|uniref:glycosyltransferase n=1 Tax=Pseudoalteromonas piscicida TaxID=43662 RepID=UPI001EFEBF3D